MATRKSVTKLPLVTHIVEVPGGLTENWIDLQVASQQRFRSELLGLRPGRHSTWKSQAKYTHRWSLLRGGYRVAHRFPGAAAGLMTVHGRFMAKRTAIFHAHFGMVAARCAPLAKCSGVPLMASFYGVDAAKRIFRVSPWTERYRELFKIVTKVFVEGPAMRSRLEALGCPAEKLVLIRLPFANVEPIATSTDAEEARFAAVLAGRLVRKKGFDIGIRAFAQAFSPGKERLLIVGDGPERHSLQRLAAELGMSGQVTFAGGVPIPEFATLLRQAAVAMFPSLTAPDGDGEGGAPLTLTLAQHLGVPVIVSDHDDLPWASAPGTPIVPQHDVGALAQALAGLHRAGVARTRDVLHQISLARKFVREAHDPELLTRMRENAYEEAL